MAIPARALTPAQRAAADRLRAAGVTQDLAITRRYARRGLAMPAAPPPWQQTLREYERGRAIYQPMEDGSVGFLIPSERAHDRTAAEWGATGDEVLVQDQHLNFAHQDSVWATDEILRAIEVGLKESGEADTPEGQAVRAHIASIRSRGRFEEPGMIELDDLPRLPFRHCTGRVPFAGLQMVVAPDGRRAYDVSLTWAPDKLRVFGLPHLVEVREALRRGDDVAADCLLAYTDLLASLANEPEAPAIFRLPGVRTALLLPGQSLLAGWEEAAYALLRWAEDPRDVALALATRRPDHALRVFERLAPVAPDVLTPEVLAALLVHGNADTREQAVGLIPQMVTPRWSPPASPPTSPPAWRAQMRARWRMPGRRGATRDGDVPNSHGSCRPCRPPPSGRRRPIDSRP